MSSAQKLRRIMKKARSDRFPIIFVIPGSGQVCKSSVEGGAQFLMVLNAGLYRTAGVSSLGSFLPFGNANDQTEELLRNQILPRARDVPVVSGLMPIDPLASLSERLDTLAWLGIAGITNWPALGFTDGSFRRMLNEEGYTAAAEIEMLSEAQKRGFVTLGHVMNTKDAADMAASGVDALILNVGWTHETHDIFEKADRLEFAAVKINEMLKAIIKTGQDPVCLFFGGAVLLPEDTSLLYQRTGIHGYGGGSSFERIPVARLLVDNIRKFRAVPKKIKRSKEVLGLGAMVGASPAMNKLYYRIERVAPYDVSVCIEGESGVGKELVATHLHRLSRRSSYSFITLNCGAIPDTLIESEFFGHEKGAFTGAVNRRLGKFELADHGTLFLDEVAELSPKAQVSLLRVLQQKEISRVGGEEAITVDVRIIAATHQNLKSLVDQGRFRDDLYYRLNMIDLKVPPLRHRLHDIPALVDFFLAELGPQYNREVIGLSQEFMQRLMMHSWPGNVRELRHELCRALLLEDGPIFRGEEFVPAINWKSQKTDFPPPRQTFRNVYAEDSLVSNALKASGGNKSQAAKLLGISRKTLYSRLKKSEERFA